MTWPNSTPCLPPSANATDMSTSPDIRFDCNDAIATITLDRPSKLNAVTAAMWRSMIDLLSEAARNDRIRTLAVTGSGGSFSAGADLDEVRTSDGSRSEEYHQLALRALDVLRDFPKPTLALIDGPCIGGGCSLALACDVRFTTPESTFSIPAIRHGFDYDEPSLSRLVELIGTGHAHRLLLGATAVDGREAAAIGLAEVCTEDLIGDGNNYLSTVANGPPAVVTRTRSVIRRGGRVPDAMDTHPFVTHAVPGGSAGSAVHPS